MLHTKYQDNVPCGFRHEDFFMLYLNSNKTETSDFHGTDFFDPVKMLQQK